MCSSDRFTRVWLKKAALQWLPQAQYRLGIKYKLDDNLDEANFWLSKANEQGYSDDKEWLYALQGEAVTEAWYQYQLAFIYAGAYNAPEFFYSYSIKGLSEEERQALIDQEKAQELLSAAAKQGYKPAWNI